MAPESIRLFNTTPGSDPNDTFDLLAGSTFLVTYIPEPATATLLVLSGLAGCGRRAA